MAELKFDIIETLGVLSESPKGWKKELNLISWNGRDPKYDIRDWSPDKEKNGEGCDTDEGGIGRTQKSLREMMRISLGLF